VKCGAARHRRAAAPMWIVRSWRTSCPTITSGVCAQSGRGDGRAAPAAQIPVLADTLAVQNKNSRQARRSASGGACGSSPDAEHPWSPRAQFAPLRSAVKAKSRGFASATRGAASSKPTSRAATTDTGGGLRDPSPAASSRLHGAIPGYGLHALRSRAMIRTFGA